ncbi:uncharacterized protein LOC119688684 [Teleopsis dalmanni]|uniref:uncharacterized protein LOC119688684 n=1 Tax=Teleopsis dalmanni TaxID=139649 RepID=UPI0018CCD4F7|nr:uncharacterized protein LOC119688684 [Teleopsis dalmanni]
MTAKNILLFKELEGKLVENGICKIISKPWDGIATPVELLKVLKEIGKALVNNIFISEVKFSFFVIAVNSGNLKDMLPKCLSELIPSASYMTTLVKQIPKFDLLRSYIEEQKNYQCCEKLPVLILHWVLVQRNIPILTKLETQEVIEKLINNQENPHIPTHVIYANYGENPDEKDFQLKRFIYTTRFGFYSTSPNNWFKLLYEGFKSNEEHANAIKNICIVNDIGTALAMTPTSTFWKKSCCGNAFKVIAACEFLFRREFLELTVDATINGPYILVKNLDIVRLRYLMLYSEDIPAITPKEELIKQPIVTNYYILPVGCVVLLLATTGLIWKYRIYKNVKYAYVVLAANATREQLKMIFSYVGEKWNGITGICSRQISSLFH